MEGPGTTTRSRSREVAVGALSPQGSHHGARGWGPRKGQGSLWFYSRATGAAWADIRLSEVSRATAGWEAAPPLSVDGGGQEGDTGRLPALRGPADPSAPSPGRPDPAGSEQAPG